MLMDVYPSVLFGDANGTLYVIPNRFGFPLHFITGKPGIPVLLVTPS
jgi:hypothetical protein